MFSVQVCQFHSVHIVPLFVMLLLQEGTTLSQAERVSSSSSSLLLCAHASLHQETLLSCLTTSGTSARCCSQQESGRSLLSSVCLVATWALLQCRNIFSNPSRPEAISNELGVSPLFACVQIFLSEDSRRYEEVSAL